MPPLSISIRTCHRASAPVRKNLVRLNHTGQRARFEAVLGNVVAYNARKLGFEADIPAAAAAVAAYHAD